MANKVWYNDSIANKDSNVKKKQDKFNLFLNMQGSFDANFRDGFEEGCLLYTSRCV